MANKTGKYSSDLVSHANISSHTIRGCMLKTCNLHEYLIKKGEKGHYVHFRMIHITLGNDFMYLIIQIATSTGP